MNQPVMPESKVTPAVAADPALPTVSVIITCYNYGRFLPAAIDSVLAENVSAEIIVVDDCSTDDSRDVMRRYGDRIIPIFQTHNQGHAGAFNAGWARATGDFIYFLDADDFVLQGGLRRALQNCEPGVLLYQYRMRYADEMGVLAGIHPSPRLHLGSGDLSQQLRNEGRFHVNVTSGLLFAREGLQKVMPIDAAAFRISGEGYLVSVIPLYGPVRSYDETLSAYRLHAAQNWKVRSDFAARARKGLDHDFQRYAAIRQHAAKLDLPVAVNLGDADLPHLNDRLLSLSFAPDEHPIAGDSIARVVRLAKAAHPHDASSGEYVARWLWWTAMGILPGGARRTLLRWKMDPNVRPGWVSGLARFARRRFGIFMH